MRPIGHFLELEGGTSGFRVVERGDRSRFQYCSSHRSEGFPSPVASYVNLLVKEKKTIFSKSFGVRIWIVGFLVK